MTARKKSGMVEDARCIDTIEVAKRLSVSPSTVQSLIYSGALPSINLGRKDPKTGRQLRGPRRVDVRDLDSYLARLRAEQGLE